MLQRLHLAHSSDHRLVALVVGAHTLRVWINEGDASADLDPLQVPCSLDIQTGHVEVLGLSFIDDHTLLCVHANGVVQQWRFDSAQAHDSGEALTRARQTSPPAASREMDRGKFVDRLDSDAIVSFVSPELGALLCWEIEIDARLKSSDLKVHPETGTLYAAFGGITGEVFWMSVSGSSFVMMRRLGKLGSCVNLTTLCARGTHVATSCRDHRVAVWRPLQDHDEQPWLVFQDSSAEIWALAFSSSSRYLAGGGIDNGIYLWDLEAGSLRAKRFDHSGWISDLAWSDHDRVLASASWDNSVGVYRGNDLMPLYQLELHTDYVSSVLFIPDTTLLISASYDHKLAVWDWSQAALVRVFDDHTDWVQALVYRGKGEFMSASSDRCVHLWSSSPLAWRAALVEGSIKTRLENRTVASIPAIEPGTPALALHARATPSDVHAALNKALGEVHNPRTLKAHLSSLDASSSPTEQRLGHRETWPETPSGMLPLMQSGSEEHTENLSLRNLAQHSESEYSDVASADSSIDELPTPPPITAFGSRAHRIEGESLTSGRLRSPLRAEESGVHNLQEMSLAVDAVDVFRLMDSHSSPIVIIPSGHSEAFSSSHLPVPPASSNKGQLEQDPTREISRDVLKTLFRRHLDSESEPARISDVSEELAAAYSHPALSPEEITQSLFGDLTEVFEDSLQHYIQLKQDSSASAASSPQDSPNVRATLSEGERSIALEKLLSQEQPIAQPAAEASSSPDEEAASSPARDDLAEPARHDSTPDEEVSTRGALDAEDSSASTLDQALSTPLGEALGAAADDAELSAKLSAAPAKPEQSAGSEQGADAASAPDVHEPDEDQGTSEPGRQASGAASDSPNSEPGEQDAEPVARVILDALDMGLASNMHSSSPELIVPIFQDGVSEFSDAMLARSPQDLKPNPFKREEGLTVVGDGVQRMSSTEHALLQDDQSSSAIQEHEPSDPSLVQPSTSFEEQEFVAMPPGADDPSSVPKALPKDDLTALADVMSSQASEPLDDADSSLSRAPYEPSTPLPEDSSATVMHAGATQAAAEQALLQGVFEDAFASLHDAFKSNVDEPVEAKLMAIEELPAGERSPSSSAHDDDSDMLLARAFPGGPHAIEDEEDDLPSADDAPTMAGSAHRSTGSSASISPAMAALIADEESDDWYIEAVPVSPDERTVAEEFGAPASPEAALGDLPTNPGDGREHTSSSGHPLPSHTNTASFTASAFTQDDRVSSGTRDAHPVPGDQTNPGMFSPQRNERSGAAPFFGRPATAASAQVDEASANTTSFGGIVYRPQVANEPELGGNEITADAFPDMDGGISEAISQSEFVSHTPEWDIISVTELWQLRHHANQSAMKIFKRRASVSRQPWKRHDPIRAGLHNVFAASSRADAEYFAAGGATRHLSVWSFRQELIYQLPATGRIIYSLTATPDGRILISGDDKAHIDLWLIDFDEAGRGVARLKRARLDGHTAPITHLATNSSGRLLLSAGLDGTARLWNLEDGGCVSVLDHYGESLSACDFWGSGLVSVSLEGVLRLWDRRGIQIDLVEGFSPLTCVAAKRNRIYFGARNGEIFCYERGQTRPIGKHDAEVSGMSLHLDGTLITASRDGSIKIHYDDGANTVTLNARAPLTCIDIDNARIIAGTENGNVELFKQS